MKLIKFAILLFGIATLFSCQTDQRKKNLIGIWESYETHHSKVALTFYEDSVITEYLSGFYRTNSKWKVDDQNIYFRNIRMRDSVIKREMNYEYKLNQTKDTLYIKIAGGQADDYSTMKKVLVNPFLEENW